MLKWIAVGTVLQVAMVVVGHSVVAVANLFGPLGMLISLLVGLFWARGAADGLGHGTGGGALVGGACALIGIGVSVALGDVGVVILAVGTLASALTGALGGAAGYKLRPASSAPASGGP